MLTATFPKSYKKTQPSPMRISHLPREMEVAPEGPPIGRHSLLRELNTAAVLEAVSELRRFTMLALAHQTALSQGTLTTIVRQLGEEGFVRPLKDGPSEGGRPPRRYEWNPRARFVVGVDLDARGGLAAGVADLDGNLVGEVGAWPSRDLEVEPAEVLEAIAEALGAAGVDRERLVGIGCAARGVLDPSTGTVLWGSTLSWRNVPLREMLEARFGAPAWVEDYSRVMALAEHALPGTRASRDLIYVHVGRGVSAGIVIAGQLYPRAGNHAGEFGHTVVAMEGEPCACGRRGCLETLASWNAVRRRIREALAAGMGSRLHAVEQDGTDWRLEDIAAAAEGGDAVAREAIQEAVSCAARGIANLVNLLNPERVVVGGSLVEACPQALTLMKQIVAAESMPTAAARVELVAPALSQNAGLRAAAMLALRGWSESSGWLRTKA